ncbi:NaeI family type II restriction endonuclease [Streptomyces sp. WAC 06725]|uniref:NaeI family type II restriction endonuclease n=1 Tax=Streptomyces sp. WAC 06725 TaxID=2203209 RepID=UPI00163BFE7B|nr:NaeI family type II restriction endonuclease [Streptomyces sp. WAC 06725]
MSSEDALFSVPENPVVGGEVLPDGRETDDELERVVQWFGGAVSDLENRFSSVMRQSLDEVLDGQRTGRYDVQELEKTEKTYLGTKVEIVCRAEFGIPYGAKLDYLIAGAEVDAKFSLSGKWMIPTEAMGHLCLLMSADDKSSSFDVGMMRIGEDVLAGGKNKDGKRQISSAGRRYIKWLCKDGALQENLLLGLDAEMLSLVMSVPSGQSRVDQLFRCVQGRVIDRNAVLTTGKQLDAPKRVRDSRRRLASEGIVILGHQNDSPHVSRALGLPVADKGTWVAVRLVPALGVDNRRRLTVEGIDYVVAQPGEPPVPAPRIRY